MSTTLKIFGLAAIAGAVIWGIKIARDAFADFAYKISGFGIPQFNTTNFRLSLPIQIRFNNPTPININVDEVIIHEYLVRGTEHIYIGEVVERNIALPPGVSIKEITPHLNIGTLISQVKDIIQSVTRDRRITLYTVVTITYKGITLPQQTTTDTIDL
jgi:hypothetical protein